MELSLCLLFGLIFWCVSELSFFLSCFSRWCCFCSRFHCWVSLCEAELRSVFPSLDIYLYEHEYRIIGARFLMWNTNVKEIFLLVDWCRWIVSLIYRSNGTCTMICFFVFCFRFDIFVWHLILGIHLSWKCHQFKSNRAESIDLMNTLLAIRSSFYCNANFLDSKLHISFNAIYTTARFEWNI